jgi:glucan biosynthesis protein
MFGAWKVGPGPNQKQSRGAEYHYWGTPMLVRAHYPHWVVFRSTVRAGRRQRLVWFCELAKKSAGEAFRAPPPIPDYLKSLSYDQYRDIRFDVKRSLWRDRGNFQLQLIHPGFLYGYAVRLSTIEAGVAKPVNFDPTLFTYGRNKFAEKIPADLGFAGFRVAYPLNQRSQFDHVVVFAGASYSERWRRVRFSGYPRAAWRSTRACRAAKSFRSLLNSGSNGPPTTLVK